MASRVARRAGAASLPVTRTVLAIRSSSPSSRSAAGGPAPARQLLLQALLDHVIGENRKLLLLLRFLRHDAPHISCSPARRRQPMTTPPPTMTVSPVMNDACGEARKSTADATSSGVPQRARGVAPTTERLVASSTSSPHLVLIQPGATTLTRTRGANSRARDRLSARMPP